MLDALWRVTRPVLFRMDAERAHRLVLGSMGRFPGPAAATIRALSQPTTGLPCPRIGDLDLAGPIGLAAGLDKDGEATTVWPALGFGFIELGTVTALAQPGNDRPRLFRLVDERGLINRMGFNNEGSEAMARRLRAVRDAEKWPGIPVGANIGKSKVTPLEAAEEDYLTSLGRLRDLVDYITINVSSPNTPGLRELQEPERLARLLGTLVPEAAHVPLLVKLAPDFDDDALAEALEVVVEAGCSGVIATNTTNTRPGTTGRLGESGGLSGAPLWRLARDRIGTILEHIGGRVPVIGVGGISSAAQARELLSLGCTAVQVYSALIFEGPGLVHRLNRGLAS